MRSATRASPRRTAPADGEWSLLHALTLGTPLAASVSVMSPVAPAGGRLTFGATGFTPGRTLQVYLDYDMSAALGSFPLDADGDSADLTRVLIPSSVAPGVHVLTFDDGEQDFDLQVQAVATTATVTVIPTSVAPGAELLFTGSAFPPDHVVHAKLDDTGEPIRYSTRPNGELVGEFRLPDEIQPGTHELRFLATTPPVSVRAEFRVVA